MATTINTGTALVTVLNAAERVTGRRGYWEVDNGAARVVVTRKRDALRMAARVARAERAAARRRRAAHAVFLNLPRAEQAALMIAMNTGRDSDQQRAQRLYSELHLLARAA